MPFKPLFDEYGLYTNDANDLDREVWKALAPLFNRGYSPRDVMTIVTLAATSECCGTMLQLGMERRKKKKELNNNSSADGVVTVTE